MLLVCVHVHMDGLSLQMSPNAAPAALAQIIIMRWVYTGHLRWGANGCEDDQLQRKNKDE